MATSEASVEMAAEPDANALVEEEDFEEMTLGVCAAAMKAAFHVAASPDWGCASGTEDTEGMIAAACAEVAAGPHFE